MPSPVEIAIETYFRVFGEADPALRMQLLEACLAPDIRFVTRSRELRGRAAVAGEVTRTLADPQLLRFRIVSAIDAQGTTFRYRSLLDRRDGTSLEFFDAGEIDAAGRISLLLLFGGPLQLAAERVIRVATLDSRPATADGQS
jgi:hypothetical protein